MVPLSELVTQHTTLVPLSVNHQGQFPAVTLSFNLKANAPLGPAVAAINQAMQSLHVPPTIQASFSGQCPGIPGLAVQHTDPDRRGTHRRLHHPRHAL